MSTVVFRLPDVGEGLAEAEVVDWMVAVGSEVHADQPVVTIETAKAQVELPAPADGTVLELSRGVGDMVPIGEPLFVLQTTDTGDPPETQRPPASEPAAVPAAADGDTPRRRGTLAAPSIRRLAVEHGIDLTELIGTGPDGHIVRSDVEAAVASPKITAAQPTVDAAAPTSVPEDEVHSLRGLRRQVARAMTTAWAIPHITEFREIDATELERAHDAVRIEAEQDGVRVTLLSLLVRLTVAALRRHTHLNATLDMDAETVHVHRHHDIGIAAATPDGLIVPVLRDAGRRDLTGLAREIARLGDSARKRSLAVDETTGGTFTVSNFGSYGTWLGTPLINAPQVAIAGFGRVHDAVVAVDGEPAVRRVLPVAVAADHRLIDGEGLGGFVATLERFARSPLLLLGEDA